MTRSRSSKKDSSDAPSPMAIDDKPIENQELSEDEDSIVDDTDIKNEVIEESIVLQTDFKELPIDIDEADGEDPRFVSTFVKDIHIYYGLIEMKNRVNNVYLKTIQSGDITPEIREKLIDWMGEVYIKFRLLSESMFLSVFLLDRFCERRKVSKSALQLIAATCMVIAAKFEEIYSPEIDEFVYISDRAFTKSDVITMEQTILNTLEWNISVPTPIHFLRRFSKAARSDTKGHTLAKYLIELSLPAYHLLQYLPSHISASATYLSRRMLGREPFWDQTLIHYTGYQEADILTCSRDLNELCRREFNRPIKKAVTTTYSSTTFGCVAKIPPVSF